MNHRYAFIAIATLALSTPPADAANQAEDVSVNLGWNMLQLHASQTLAGSTPVQYSAKNLFDPSPAKAWVFHGEPISRDSEQIANPATLTLTLMKPSSLFAVALTPGYAKSAATQFQNASPKSVTISLYRSHEDKPFETRRFALSYHAREYSLPQLQRELKTVAFSNQSDDKITGKSDNALNSAERLLLVNAGGAQIAKLELKISAIEPGAKFTDVAVSKLRLLDRQADQSSAEFRLARFITRNLDKASKQLVGASHCLVYTEENPWPLLSNHACTSQAAKLQQGQADQGVDDVILSRKDPASRQYQVPFAIALRDAQASGTGNNRRLRLSAADVANNELILGKNAGGQLQALSGLALTQAFLANRTDGFDKAYLQPQASPYFFFAYARPQFTPYKDGYQLSIYGPAGHQEAQWATK
ncbi:hypothetical protein [Chromobacterium paludis]|uniref:Uncharacterized protein n=1 Tax=Chromobacterium paludis TaxID=2605945 RepID=A0A5C1DFZ4_9NEIS|nr:hypothetical protein [Chromobacterium paludis]QEL54867.1 hypothetical protein FYK34_04435 [Chromobacterium paludis]